MLQRCNMKILLQFCVLVLLSSLTFGDEVDFLNESSGVFGEDVVGCYSGKFNRTFAVGETWNEVSCGRAECVDDWLDGLPGILLLGCEYIVQELTDSNCELAKFDINEEWPSCCLAEKCKERDVNLRGDAEQSGSTNQEVDEVTTSRQELLDLPLFEDFENDLDQQESSGSGEILLVTTNNNNDEDEDCSLSTGNCIPNLLKKLALGRLSCGDTNCALQETSTCVGDNCDQNLQEISPRDNLCSGSLCHEGASLSDAQEVDHIDERNVIDESLDVQDDASRSHSAGGGSNREDHNHNHSHQDQLQDLQSEQPRQNEDSSEEDLREATFSSQLVPSSVLVDANKTDLLVDEDLSLRDLSLVSSAPESRAVRVPLSTDSDACRQQNGGCSHLCATSISGVAECSCPSHMQLDGNDNRTCLTDHARPRLLFSSRHELQLMDMDGANRHVLADQLANAVGLDYDWSRRCVFWTLVQSSGSLYRMCNDEQPRELWSDGIRPDNVAVDWVTGNVYWTDGGRSSISVTDPDGLYRRTLVSSGIGKPRAIVLYPEQGRLYYTDWGESASIGQVNMDGSAHWLIVTSGLYWPNALTLSRASRQLFWADAKLGHIEVADLSGSNRRILLRSPPGETISQLQHIFSLDVHAGSLFWSSWEAAAVISYNGSHAVTLANSSSLPMAVRVFHHSQQPPLPSGNPCHSSGNSGKCPALCLLAIDGGATCVCPDETQLIANDTRCSSPCAPDEFQCKSLRCVSSWLVCNGQDDCGDGSDEPEFCPPFLCGPDRLQCRTGQCISPEQVCNGQQDCLDGADEATCDS